jgi:SAM-dependent methyltransferase
VRWRSVISALSMELFGRSLGIWEFPPRPDLAGMGLSDWHGYASRLPSKLSYRNTFYDSQPRLDISNPPSELEGTLDFLISSDVYEHVLPPVDRAFENTLRLLKPGGLLVCTVPYTGAEQTVEHYENLHEYEVAEVDGDAVLINRTADGRTEVFKKPVFHGGPGETLEMRQFSREGALEGLRAAGFEDVVLCEEAFPDFGVVWPLPYGLPILARRPQDGASPTVATYDSREHERRHFGGMEKIHDLPPIFHYWSRHYVAPKLAAVGMEPLESLFLDPIAERCRRDPGKVVKALSVGAGNCDHESSLAVSLMGLGLENFQIDCVELNGEMLERGRRTAEGLGVAGKLGFVESDVKDWSPESSYDVCIALQSIHHFADLESLFAKVNRSLEPDGVFVVNDIIGRNGHMRWPEALVYVEYIWQRMPDRYKYNNLRKHVEVEYENWDCSTTGFGGIRSQDILPLMIETFHFESFLAFGNIIDVFVDRAFGHNLNVELEEDCAFIDRVALLDDRLIDEGIVKPTHMIARLQTQPVDQVSCYRHWTPDFCVRPAGAPASDLEWFET